MRRALASALAACALAACAGSSRRAVSTDSLALETWIEIQTPLFTLDTNAARADALRMARQLCAFTELLRRIMNIGRVEPALPMRIYVFERADQFERFPIHNAAGYALPSLRGTRLVLSLEPNGLATPILYHEYVHYLLMNGQALAYPPWYHEGLAEMLGSTVVRGDVAFVGGVPHWRAAALSRGGAISLEELFDTSDPSSGGSRAANQFYADAWLVVHYLHTSAGVHGGPERLRPMQALLRELNRGQQWREAFAGSFDVSPAQLEDEIEAHRARIENQMSVLTVTLPAPTIEPQARSLTRAEAAVLLAELGLNVKQLGLAESLLDGALAEHPDDARAHALRALCAAQREDPERERAEIGLALRLAPLDPVIQETQGDLWAMRAHAEQDASQLAHAREAYARAAELAPEVPSAWAALGSTYLDDGDCAGVRRGIDALERARALAPWHPGINLDLGRLYGRIGDADSARRYLSVVTSVAHGSELVERAREALRELDGEVRPHC